MTRGLAILVAFAACGGDGRPDAVVDAAPDAGRLCTELTAAWESVVDSIDPSCVDDVDCATIGGGAGPGASCDCTNVISLRWGVAVTGRPSAQTGSLLRALEAEYEERCTDCFATGVNCTSDCPYAFPACVDGRCVVDELAACNPEPVDASLADAAL